MSEAERLEVAKELAAKDKRTWEDTEEYLKNAYLHNADEAIADRAAPVTKEGEPAVPLYTCPFCQDKAWLKGKGCPECNPVGLPAKEVHPQVIKIEATLPKMTPLKKGQYLCSKCGTAHYEEKKTGKKHLKYKVLEAIEYVSSS